MNYENRKVTKAFLEKLFPEIVQTYAQNLYLLKEICQIFKHTFLQFLQ